MISVLMMFCALSFVHPAEGGKAFTMVEDEFGPVYHVDINKVKSAEDLMAVPGIKIAWDLHGGRLSGWLANAADWDGDGKIDLVFAAETNGSRCIVRFTQDGKKIWSSEQINQGLGHESGMAIKDLDGDGKYEISCCWHACNRSPSGIYWWPENTLLPEKVHIHPDWHIVSAAPMHALHCASRPLANGLD